MFRIAQLNGIGDITCREMFHCRPFQKYQLDSTFIETIFYTNNPGWVFYCERTMRKFLGCVFLTICCHYAQSSRILLGTEYSNEPRHGEYSARPPQWRTKENFWKFYKPEQRRTSRNIQSGHNPTRNNINT